MQAYDRPGTEAEQEHLLTRTRPPRVTALTRLPRRNSEDFRCCRRFAAVLFPNGYFAFHSSGKVSFRDGGDRLHGAAKSAAPPGGLIGNQAVLDGHDAAYLAKLGEEALANLKAF